MPYRKSPGYGKEGAEGSGEESDRREILSDGVKVGCTNRYYDRAVTSPLPSGGWELAFPKGFTGERGSNVKQDIQRR